MERIPVTVGRYLIRMSPEEIQDIIRGTKLANELGVKAAAILSRQRDPAEPITEAERQIGGVHHAVLEENMPFDEAEARLKLIAEMNASDHPTEDK